MSGHSKWSTIKRKKGEADAKKGKIFTKLVREINTAARIGGGDVDANPRLRAAITVAKSARMPAENIARAIKRGIGESDGPPVEELSYEGYGAGGVAFLVECQTDNRNRTSAELRSAFSKHNGNMGQSGSVAYMFKHAGLFEFDADKYSEDEIMEAALEGGAEDVATEGAFITVLCDPKSFAEVINHFDKLSLTYDNAEMTYIPDNSISVTGKAADQVLKLVERLEDLDDVQKVHANFGIAEEELERLANA